MCQLEETSSYAFYLLGSAVCQREETRRLLAIKICLAPFFADNTHFFDVFVFFVTAAKLPPVSVHHSVSMVLGAYCTVSRVGLKIFRCFSVSCVSRLLSLHSKKVSVEQFSMKIVHFPTGNRDNVRNWT